jgi:hypothetical protein
MAFLQPHQQARLNRQSRRREVKRLKAHFAGALELLEANGDAALSEGQRSARNDRIADLRRYALRGQFPKNRDFHDRMMPYFVDGAGTRCAVAHLVERSGDADLVRKIVGNRNNQLVPELAREPRLVAWLESQGITLAEATRIQPSYCSNWASVCGLCAYADGVVEIQLALRSGVLIPKVEATHGRSVYSVGDVFEYFYVPQNVQAGDRFIATDDGIKIYPINDDGSVNTSSCEQFMFGDGPDTALKAGLIDYLLGNCSGALGSGWTTQIGGGCSSGAKGSSGVDEDPEYIGDDGGGGRDVSYINRDDGCAAAPNTSPFGGALFFASLLIGGAIRLRTRRVRK